MSETRRPKGVFGSVCLPVGIGGTVNFSCLQESGYSLFKKKKTRWGRKLFNKFLTNNRIVTITHHLSIERKKITCFTPITFTIRQKNGISSNVYLGRVHIESLLEFCRCTLLSCYNQISTLVFF